MNEEELKPEALVEDVRNKMIPEGCVKELASFFKVFGDESRVRILYALSSYEMCVNDLAEALGMSQSSLSHQLKLLKLNGLVKYRRDGRNIYYSLDDQHVVDVFNEGLEHITHRMREHQ